MAFTLIARAKTGGSAGFTSDPVDTTGANLLVLSLGWAAGTTATISDSNSNTFIPLTTRTGTNWSHRMYYCLNPIVGASHTFTLSGTNIFGLVFVQAWSGAHASSSFDQQNGAGAPTGTVSTLQPGSITPSADNELVVTGVIDDDSINLPVIDSGFTIAPGDDQIGIGGAFSSGAIAYLIQTTATAVNPTWSHTAGLNDIATNIASFKVAGGGGGGGGASVAGAKLLLLGVG